MNWVSGRSSLVNNPGKKSQKLFFKITLIACVAMGSVACRPSVNSACSRLPILRGEIQAMRQAMNPYTNLAQSKAKGSRKPASVRPDPMQMPKEEWMSHAEDWIKMSQDFRDALHEDESANRKALVPLNEASLQLVTLHGYIDQGKITKAMKALELVERNVADFAKKTCNSR